MNTKVTREEFLKLRDTLRNVNSWMHSKYARSMETTCVRCLNFDQNNEICKLANARPPAKVIAYGCQQFDDEDNIPY